MPQVTLTHPDGSTDTVPYTVGWEQQAELNKMRRVLIDVNREELAGVTLQPKRDRVELDGVDDVQLVDVQRGSSTHTLVCYSAEWLDTREPYLSGGEVREGSDSGLVRGLIGDVAAWSEGNVSEFATGLSFVFNHSAPGGALRTIERNVPGEIQFRDFGAVDYVDSLGSDKTGSVTLSADAGTIEQAIQITDRGRELDGTHVRILGAHEGEAQIVANLVPEDDPDTYENEVRYSTPRWSGPADTDWSRWPNKDVTDQQTAYTEAEALADELENDYVEAETVVPSAVGLEVGDWVRVVKPGADLDREMRVHRRTRRAGSRSDADGSAAVVDHVVLSTRTTVRRDDDDDMVTRTQFETGYQGASVVVNAGPFGKAVDASNPLTFSFRYPNLAYENAAQLQIKGREYRIDSQGADAGGGDFTTTQDNSDFANVVSANQSDFGLGWSGANFFETPLIQDDIPSGTTTSFVVGHAHVNLEELSGVSTAEFDIWLEDGAGNRYPDGGETYAVSVGESFGIAAVIANDQAGETVDINITETTASDSGSLSYSAALQAAGPHTHEVSIGDHTHDPQAGIYTTNDTPSGVDVSINGTEVATDIGSGTFETVLDVPGEFLNDAWNDVVVSSDSLGIIEVSAFIEGYDQIGAT